MHPAQARVGPDRPRQGGRVQVGDAVQGVGRIDRTAYHTDYIVICQRGLLAEESRKRGLEVGYVFLAHRGYGDDGMPVPRSHEGGLIHDPELIGQRSAQVVREGTVRSVNGKAVPLGHDADVLLHGDHPSVLANGTALRDALGAAGIRGARRMSSGATSCVRNSPRSRAARSARPRARSVGSELRDFSSRQTTRGMVRLEAVSRYWVSLVLEHGGVRWRRCDRTVAIWNG